MAGLSCTVTDNMPVDVHPFVAVNVNCAMPAETAVTNPVLFTVATPGLDDNQVPPEEGDNCVVLPKQIEEGPAKLTGTVVFILTADVVSDAHPVLFCVNINRALPWEIPVTRPEFVMLATAGLTDVQVPPVEGDIWVVCPTQTEDGPDTCATGFGLTCITALATALQPKLLVTVTK